MKIIACITTRNEMETIGRLVAGLRAHAREVVVVDAASTDDTVEAARAAGAYVIAATERIPIGPALLRAWAVALDLGATKILQMDAGGSHDLEDVPAMLTATSDLVIGSRFCRQGLYVGGRWWRRLGSRVMARLCDAASGHERRIYDWTSGFRVFRAPVAQHLLLKEYRATMHGWQMEVLAHAIVDGYTVSEVPITYWAGRSSFNWSVLRETFRVWRWVHEL